MSRRAMLRYQVPVDDAEHELRLASNPRHVEIAKDALDVVEFWAEGYPDDPQEGFLRRFRAYGTGHTLPESAQWWGTTTRKFGLVWHLYEVQS